MNNNSFSSPNAKKFRPSFERRDSLSQDERSTPLQTEPPKKRSPNRKQQQPQHQEQQHMRKPERQKSPPKEDTRLVMLVLHQNFQIKCVTGYLGLPLVNVHFYFCRDEPSLSAQEWPPSLRYVSVNMNL